ncbi:unnamed protein product [Mesocestoides corti]|uniref:Cyclic nucleotide-binding domain-containing protein n=2 Tax=Mesocestoides corti TaxID=53468 RepID=A0A158QVD3_MESCO|nr:unnamed protein product [Mesocestoides corti]
MLAFSTQGWLYELSERTDAYYGANMTGGPSRSSIYISSLYFMMSSLTSVGFGNVSPNTSNEKVFSIIAMLVGALMHAAVFGNVTTIIQRMYTRRSTYQTKYQDLKDFTRAHHLPKQLRQRMLEFYQAMWSINRGIDKQTIMQVFPEEMRGDIALHINREMLSLSVFKSASIGCQKSIAQLIETRFATPGEFLVHKGDAIKNLYFVCSGSLEILGESGSVVALLGKCDLFGTDIDDRPFIGLSAYDVKALTYCELQYLVLDSTLFCILDLYPAYSKEFSAALHDELSFNIKEGYDPFAHDEVETLAAITKPQCSPQESSRASLKPPLEISSGSQIRSSVSSLQRSVEEGDPNLSPDPCGSHEHLLGRARGNRWYLPSSVDYDDPDETFKRRVSMNGAGTKIALTLRDNRRHFSLGEICDGKTNPPIGPFLSSCRESEGSNSARQLCSMEVVNERFLNETTQNRAPPPSPCTTSLPADPSCEVQVSKCEPDELKDLLCKLIQDVQEMRVELRSLATDVSILKHQQHQQKQQQQQDQHVTGLNSSPQRSVPKASIMKSPTTPNFTVDQSPESTNSSEDGFGKKGSRSLISTGGNVFFSSTCSQPRCVKFNLPEKPRKINMERHLHVLDKRRGSSEVSSSSSDALIGLSSAAENRK